METAGFVIAACALVVAGWSAWSSHRAASAATGQTLIQRQMHEDAAQPYVWVDLRPSDEHAQLLLLMVGNSGPTVATDVRVHIEGDIERGGGNARGTEARAVLERGISALAPGRSIAWNLGVPWTFFPEDEQANDEPIPVTFTVDARGPFGPIPTLRYAIDPADIRASLAVPPGTLNGVARAVKDLGTSLTRQMRDDARSIAAATRGDEED